MDDRDPATFILMQDDDGGANDSLESGLVFASPYAATYWVKVREKLNRTGGYILSLYRAGTSFGGYPEYP